MRTVAYSEIEAFAIELLLARMEGGALDAAPIWSDLKTFPWESFRDKVDILSGGYPCQPFSTAGKRAGKDDPRHLWPWIADGIRLVRPRVCFFENVEGHVSLGLRDVLGELGKLGYQVSWGIFSAAEVYAPHQRKRVFILAHRNDARLERHDHRHTSSIASVDQSANFRASSKRDVWPSRPGKSQHAWEPPRVVAHSHCSGSQKPEYEHADLPTEPSGRKAESVVNAESGARLGRASRDSRYVAQPNKTGRNRQTQSALGRSTNGTSSGLGYAELCNSCDNRTDELRLLGNGVVPATAALAFKTLMSELLN